MWREALVLAYAALLVGVPLAYIAVASVRAPRFSALAILVAWGAAIYAFPAATIPLMWWGLFAMMSVALAVFAAHIAVSARLLFAPSRRPRVRELIDPPTVAVLIPARNEASVIGACLDALLRADYPADRLSIVVLDDLSTDHTAQIVAGYARRCPNVHLVARAPDAPRGKAAALNEGLAALDAEYVVICDADHQVAASFFRTTLPHFDDPRVGGVQVRKAGRNWARNWLTRLMELESLGWQYSFLDAKSQERLVTPYFGAGCIFRTALLKRVGLSNDLATEDLEASFRIYEAGYRITFEPRTYTTDELVFTERGFFHQRYRWARGTTQAIPDHVRSFYRHAGATPRERLDFAFYPLLFLMMIVPHLQVATHALALVAGVALPTASVVAMPAAYFGVIFFCYVVAALRNQREGGGQGPQGFWNVVFLPIAMFAFYGVFFAVINVKAFLDEFAIGAPYRPRKSEHGAAALASAPASGGTSSALERQIVLTLGRQSPSARQIDAVAARFGEADWNRIKDVAFAHGVAGLVSANLVDAGLDDAIPSEVRAALAEHRQAVLARNLYLRHVWQSIAGAFSRAAIEVAPLKGIHLLGGILPMDVRPLFDVDILVKASRAGDAGRELEALGFQPSPDTTVNGQAWSTQRAFRHATTGIVVDLHWDLINIYSYQRIYTRPIDEVWQRARTLPDRPWVYELSPEDRIVHAALHAAIHHKLASLLHLADLRALLHAYEGTLDWDRLIALAHRHHVRTPIYSALVMSRTLVDAPVPDAAIDALRPPLYRRMCWRWLMAEPRMLLAGPQTSRRRRPRWALSSVIMADTLGDSIRAARASLAFGLAVKELD
jgi:cellulose synthase/poly-beta-1,6-N-acetylglucosamine synthase-like glycosyltransferase